MGPANDNLKPAIVTVENVTVIDVDLYLTMAGLVIAVISLVVAAKSIIELYRFERYRRPALRLVRHKDKLTSENCKSHEMWYHLKVRNDEPPQGYSRDAALSCQATIDFLAPGKDGGPITGQITAHWSNQITPRSGGTFEESLVPTSQRLDVGFREEMLDVIIKRDNDPDFYTADPWKVYSGRADWNAIRVRTDWCVLRVEIQAINGGKWSARYELRNNGPKMEDLELELLP
jgi:hypothetical protein